MNGSSVQSSCFFSECGAFDRNFTQNLGAACGTPSVDVINQRSNSCSNVSDQFDLWPVVIIDVSRSHVDVNQVSLLPTVPQAGFKLNRVVPDSDYQVSCVQDSVRGLCPK